MNRPVSHMISRVLELALKSDETLLKALDITLNSKAAEVAAKTMVDNAMSSGSWTAWSNGDL